jgi:hypothetical protein
MAITVAALRAAVVAGVALAEQETLMGVATPVAAVVAASEVPEVAEAL